MPPIAVSASAVGHNVALVLAAKSLRTFCYGFLGVVLPIQLTRLGLDAGQLGVAVTLTLLASAAMTFAIRWPAERHGAKAALIGQAGLVVVSAVLFLLARDPWLMVAAAMIG